MATKTRSRSSRDASDSPFRWGGRDVGMLAAVAVAGAAVGIAANYGRKLVVEGLSAAGGDWADSLAAEHQAVLTIFDKIEATADNQTMIRTHLLTKLKNALGKHALEEENVIYPALRESGAAHDADALNAEHGYVKTYLYELENMAKDSPEWLSRIHDFRTMLQTHMRMEEDEVFPTLRNLLSDEQNAKLTAAMHREGLKLA